MENNSTFSTDSFVLASFLLSHECILLEVDKTNPRRASFIFKKTKEIERLIKEFHTFQAKIEPHKFFNAQKDLKQRLYDQSY